MSGISTEGVGGDSHGPMSQERTAASMVSIIRNKQRKKEVENLKARTVVGVKRQKRHRKAGLGTKEEEVLLNNTLKNKRF